MRNADHVVNDARNMVRSKIPPCPNSHHSPCVAFNIPIQNKTLI